MWSTARIKGLYKTTWFPPKCVNCGGEHPANNTRCPQYLRQLHHTPQINNQQQRKPYTIKSNSPQFQYQQSQFPSLKTTQPSTSQQQSWAQAATRTSANSTQHPISSVFESLRTIMNMFTLQHLCTQMHLLAIKLQETNDPIAKLVTVIDTVVDCFSTHKWSTTYA